MDNGIVRKNCKKEDKVKRNYWYRWKVATGNTFICARVENVHKADQSPSQIDQIR